MQKVHPGQDVVSVFGIGQRSKSLDNLQSKRKQRFLIPIITAFFVVLMVGMLLRVLIGSSQASAVVDNPSEQVAFQPGKFIEQEVLKGYLK